MRRLLLGQLRHRRGRLASLGLAILVAAASFTLLTASASTSALHVRGTLKSSFRPAYDILVRPRRSETPLERRERLVRPNFLSGVYGGISFEQWHRIERIRGVAVAAPIANVGFVLPGMSVTVPITSLVDREPHQLYRIQGTWLAEDGLSRYPASSAYVYYTPQDRFVRNSPDPYKPVVEVGPNARQPQPSCRGFNSDLPILPTSPFPSLASEASLVCWPTTMENGFSLTSAFAPPTPGFVGTKVELYFPVYISAIDPVQEAKLVHLDRAVVAGRYLKPNEGFSRFTLHDPDTQHFRIAPVLASSRTFVDERLRLTVERLRIPKGVDVPRALATGTCTVSRYPCQQSIPPPRGASFRTARQFVERLRGVPVGTRTIGANSVYGDLLEGNDGKPWPVGTLGFDEYWTTTPTRYRVLAADRLAPIPVDNPPDVWHSLLYGGYSHPPFDNLDTQFRLLHGRAQNNQIASIGVQPQSPVRVVGRFDPRKLPSFSPLTKVPLETYYPPELLPGDVAARRALHGRALRPSQNVGGYIQQPPLLLTTMQGLRSFLDPRTWIGSGTVLSSKGAGSAIPKAQRRAPISAIRVKVAGVTGPDPLSLTRIRVVAQEIHSETGLAVDITAGSSPHPVLISLPKGKFGRPPLLLREGWSKKGATVSFLRALDHKDLALFALILVVCGFFLGNGAFASVRARRAELGALATLGWSPGETFRLVLAELAAVGLAAGVAGAGLAAALVAGLGLHFPLLRTLYVIPIAVGVALAAGVLPAWRAARGRPLDAVRPPVVGSGRGRRVRGLAGMALVDLARLPVRTLVGAAGLALGVAALTVLVAIERGFQGTLVGTVLGNAVSLQVRGADFVALGLTVALAALSAADVLYLNVRERQAELVTLATLGWSDRETRRLLALEAVYLAVAASVAGALVGLAVGGFVLGVGARPLGIAAAIAAAGATCATLAASLLPLLRLRGLAAPEVLAAE